MSISDNYTELSNTIARTTGGSLEAAQLVCALRRVVEAHRLHDATIAGVPMSVFKQEPLATKRESMAACLYAFETGCTWRLALNDLRKNPLGARCYFRMADALMEHIPHLDKLPGGEGT